MSRLMPAPQDGRAFTSYLSAGLREQALQQEARVTNDNQYRQFLQHNAARVASQQQAVTVPAPATVRPSSGTIL